MSTEDATCHSCARLRRWNAMLKKRVKSLEGRLATARKHIEIPEKRRYCRTIERQSEDRPHACGMNLDRSIRRKLKREPCRPMTEIGAGAIVLARCEYLRLLSCITRTRTCWLWIGRIDALGYGKFHWDERAWQAHRIVYTLFAGPIKRGMVIDHTCRETTCVNPAHLEVVTQAENLRRKIAPLSKTADSKAG